MPRLLYRPQLVVDGNMKLVHLKMKRPEEDISLSDGELFMVKRGPYAEHLEHGPQSQPVGIRKDWWLLRRWSTSRNLRAIIIGHKIMEISIGTIWTPQVRAPVHVQDMERLSRIALWTSRRENSSFWKHIPNSQMINIAQDRLTWTTQFARHWTCFPDILRPS